MPLSYTLLNGANDLLSDGSRRMNSTMREVFQDQQEVSAIFVDMEDIANVPDSRVSAHKTNIRLCNPQRCNPPK